MAKWNFVAMGQVGLTGWTKTVAQPVAHSIARRTGRPEAHILSLIGAGSSRGSSQLPPRIDAVIAAGLNPALSQPRLAPRWTAS